MTSTLAVLEGNHYYFVLHYTAGATGFCCNIVKLKKSAVR